MGSICPNFFSKSFKTYYPSSEYFTSLINFSTENDEFFYIPPKYTSICSKLSLIINSDSEFWNENKQFLKDSKKYLLETLNSLDNFLFQEDNIFENSLQKEKKITNSPESPNYIQISSIKSPESPSETFKRGRGSSMISCVDYNEKFRLKKFILEINRLFFLGENDPTQQNLENPYIELEFWNFGEKNSKNSFKFRSSQTHKEALNPIWNEIFEIDLPEKLGNSLQKVQFSIALMYRKNGVHLVIIGEKYLFSFSELMNQMLFEKIVNLRNKNDRNGCFAVVLFRCQLIHDYFKLLNYWKNEVEVKMEIINRILQKIAFEEKSQKLKRIAMNNYKQENNAIFFEISTKNKNEEKKKKGEIQRNFSLNSQENSEINSSSIYDNQYYIK